MQVAIAGEVREVEFAEVKCSQAGAIQTVELVSPHQTKLGTPRILIARLRGDEVVDAHAFLPEVSFDEFDYDMLELVADDVEGAPKPDCRVERGDQLTVICNETTVLPWLSPGDRPRPSFKAAFACP